MIFPTKVEFIPGELLNNSKVIVEPCWTGYGITLGNAIRRVLLSSLTGAAVTSVKINGALHELSAIEHVKEDVLHIILNLKQLCIKTYLAEESRLFINASGMKEIRAKDIIFPTGVVIVNPELYIATLTHKNAKLEIEMTVSHGQGYLPVEKRLEEKLDMGTIAIDAVFTPIQNVGFTVEKIMTGETANYDRLIIDITTNGTITPKEAFCEANKILVDHFNICLNASSENNINTLIPEKSPEQNLEQDSEVVLKNVKEVPEKKKRGRPKKS